MGNLEAAGDLERATWELEQRRGAAGDRRQSRRDGHPHLGTRDDWPEIDGEISPVWEVLSQAPAARPASRYAALRSRDALFQQVLAVADVVGVYIALWFSVSVIAKSNVSLRPAAALIGLFVLLASKMIGLYDRDQHTIRKTTIDELPSIVNLAVLCTLAIWVSEAVLLRGWLGRPDVVGLAVGIVVAVTVCRCVARFIALRFSHAERCLIIANAHDAARTVSKLASSPGVKSVVIGRVVLGEAENDDGSPIETLGDVRALAHVVAAYDIERAIIAPASDAEDDTIHAIRLLKALGVSVSVLPRLLEVVGSSSTFDEVDGITLLGVRHYGLSASSRLLKRMMDVVGASIALVVLAPLFLLIAIAIKLDSRGPVFFRQPRVGLGGRRFDMLKFRSMVSEAERIKQELLRMNEAEGGLFKIGDDPRITHVGRLLRPASLDELPQLFNVIRGDMSLVGPRPLVPDEDALIEGWQRRRLAVRPGMTGLWQIFGSSRIPLPEMVKIDYLYGANWSVWLDMKVLLRTVPYVLHRRGL